MYTSGILCCAMYKSSHLIVSWSNNRMSILAIIFRLSLCLRDATLEDLMVHCGTRVSKQLTPPFPPRKGTHPPRSVRSEEAQPLSKPLRSDFPEWLIGQQVCLWETLIGHQQQRDSLTRINWLKRFPNQQIRIPVFSSPYWRHNLMLWPEENWLLRVRPNDFESNGKLLKCCVNPREGAIKT